MNRSLLPASCAVLICMIVLILNPGCSPETVSGGGTEGGNTVCGVLVNDDESPSVNSRVYLLPSDFNPGISDLDTYAHSTTTDEEGSYVFDNTAQGDYSIQAENSENGKNTLITGINVAGVDIAVPADTLREPGVMLVELPEAAVSIDGYLYVPGTTIHTSFTNTSKIVVINNVPAKKLPPVCLANRNDSTSDILRYDVEINSNDTVVVRNTEWKYSRRLYLNTTTTGADVNETVADFPIVVRLTETDIDFSRVQADGDDIRFYRADSVPLVHEIERWDPVTGLVEVWVRVDTIYGNDSAQFIMMYWGNPDAAGNATDVSVFDTALGFQGVWHLDGNTDTVYDATPNRFNGVRNGTITASSGMVGVGQRFQGSGAFIDMGNVLNTGNNDLTVSAWIKRSTTGLQTIMAKSDGGSPPYAEYGWTLSLHTDNQLHFFAASGGTFWGDYGAVDCRSKEGAPFVDTTEWHFIIVVFDRSDKGECRLYIDGVDMTGDSNADVTGVSDLVNDAPFRVGAEGDGDYKWTGLIDECVIAHVIRSESWIRLCYSNQGQKDRLIQFK